MIGAISREGSSLLTRSSHISSVSRYATKYGPYIPRRTLISSPQDIITVLSASMTAAHELSNVSWVFLIPLTTVTLRSLWTLPLAINQRKRSQVQASLRPIINAMGPIFRLKLAQRAQMAKSMESSSEVSTKEGVPQGVISGTAAGLSYEQIVLMSSKERRERQKQMFRENECQMYKNLIVPVFQIPLWIAMSATIRDLTGWNDISTLPMDSTLQTEGILWFTDLTIADPYSILPIVLGTVALTNVEWNFRTFGIQNFGVRRSKRITAFDSMMNLSRFGVVFLMAIATQAPAGLVLYWISSNAFSLVQNILLDFWIPLKYNALERFSFKKATKNSVSMFKRNLASH